MDKADLEYFRRYGLNTMRMSPLEIETAKMEAREERKTRDLDLGANVRERARIKEMAEIEERLAKKKEKENEVLLLEVCS